MSNNGDCYGTPMDLYQQLNQRFDFTLDPCAWPGNRLDTPKFYTEIDNGLVMSWSGHRVFLNPPYSKPDPWTEKAYNESLRGALVVGLLRHDPSTRWWNKWIKDKAIVIPIPYRLKFVNFETKQPEGSYNFPSAIVIWHGLFVPRGLFEEKA